MNRIFLVLFYIFNLVVIALATCTVTNYEEGIGNRVKCLNESLSKALDQGNNVVAAILIIQSDIRQLPKDTFIRYAKTLVALNLHYCNIKDIDDDAFRGLTYIQKLSLSSNNISQVKDRWFREMSSLQQLDLSYNQIKTIQPLAFIPLSNLRRLDLSENQLGCLENNVLQPLRSLDKLRFHGNPWTFECRAKLTLWLRDHGVNYKIDPRGPEFWLDNVLWLCAADDSIPLGDKNEQMVECVILNLFNQLRTVWTLPGSPSIPQQCSQGRKDLTKCLVTGGHKSLTYSATNGGFIKNLLLQLRESKSSI
ncbi:PREDICTED: leucine-rich repeat-containing protein 26-like [Polistes canadensis]|uniref:leucine-rich repeat-containing protein 26-like n=1 Tax=Polistes canadensis TaxID=91411 RepID=UPI000718BB5E|nr:PREDICTED: leucine-rich repeat-containing protein 26-like [Polistes canadensis]